MGLWLIKVFSNIKDTDTTFLNVFSFFHSITEGYTGLITSWQIDGETVETVTYFIFLGSKITADGDCSDEIQRRLLPGRKTSTNLDGILKSRDITLQRKVCLVKAMVFPVVLYGCKSWIIRRLSTKEAMLSNCGVGEDS